jgi:uncharacterized protein YhhL (DUF1145 family)
MKAVELKKLEGLCSGHSILGGFWFVLFGIAGHLTFTLSLILRLLFGFLIFAHTIALIINHDKLKQARKQEKSLPQRSRLSKLCNLCIRLLLVFTAVFVLAMVTLPSFVQGLLFSVFYMAFFKTWLCTITPEKERKT